MAIKVMSSFCGCEPTKLRSSSINRVIIAGAPLGALARTRLDHAFDAKFVSVCVERFGHSVRVKNQAIVAFERDGEIARYPIEHASAVNSERPCREA